MNYLYVRYGVFWYVLSSGLFKNKQTNHLKQCFTDTSAGLRKCVTTPHWLQFFSSLNSALLVRNNTLNLHNVIEHMMYSKIILCHFYVYTSMFTYFRDILYLPSCYWPLSVSHLDVWDLGLNTVFQMCSDYGKIRPFSCSSHLRYYNLRVLTFLAITYLSEFRLTLISIHLQTFFMPTLYKTLF